MKVLKRSTWLHGPTLEMTSDEYMAYKFGRMRGITIGLCIGCIVLLLVVILKLL